jgi:hypothetical protein
MKTAMPSPRGTNRAQLFIPSASGFALDAAPERLPLAKMTRWLHEKGVADDVIDEFVRLCHAEQDTAEDVESTANEYENMSAEEQVARYGKAGMTQSERVGSMTNKDELPTNRRNGTPKNDVDAKNGTELGMDARSLRDLMKHTKIGYP